MGSMIPIGPTLGREMLISCWHCNLSLMRLTVGEGAHLLTCSRCARVTKVLIVLEGTSWSLKCGPP